MPRALGLARPDVLDVTVKLSAASRVRQHIAFLSRRGARIAWPEGSVEPRSGEAQAPDWLAAFRCGLYGCLTARADELFELADLVLRAGAGAGASGAAAAGVGGRADPAGGRCQQLCGRTRRTSPERLFCHCYGPGKNSAQMMPGWPYSFVAALEPARRSLAPRPCAILVIFDARYEPARFKLPWTAAVRRLLRGWRRSDR
jgi:hypothetical protein